MSNISGGETMVRSQSGPRLVGQQGSERGRTFAIPPTGLLVGRAGECNLVLDDVEISRRHARFSWQGSRLVVEDLGSANGTVVNGRPISGPQPLNERDIVGIGNSVFIVQGLTSQELTPTARNLDAAAPAMSPRYAATPPKAADSGSTLWLVLIGLVLAAILAILGIGSFWYFSQSPSAVSQQTPAVTIINPANGAQIELNVPLIVQATATDSRGVVRMELWADGVLVSQQASPSPQGASPLLLNLTWTPTVPGSHVLELRAFNTANQQSTPALVTINVAAGTPTATTEPVAIVTPTPAPSDTPTATAPAIVLFTLTPSPTPTTETQPVLQAVADVNVRSGPGTNYNVLGLLRAGQAVEAVGRSPEGAWWQIVFPPNTGALGWVVGTYVQPNAAAGDVPVVSGPPSPPTNTPSPPTPTDTPEPSADVTFTADSTLMYQGQCTRLRWQVRNVAAYFVDGVAGAGDVGDREVCDPVGTTTHTLRIQRRDDSVQDFTVTITVQSNNVPRPSLISPGDNENFDWPDDDVEFVWSAVSAPGQVTYSIEIQSEDDGDWENWRRVNGLTDTRYRMNEFAGARPGRWRVWATSSTLGDSDRTGWREFKFED
jgi:uncharacterized protein YraI